MHPITIRPILNGFPFPFPAVLAALFLVLVAPLEAKEDKLVVRGDTELRRKLRGELRVLNHNLLGDLAGWWMDRMVRTRRPLEEKMTLFLHGWFTSEFRKVKSCRLMYA